MALLIHQELIYTIDEWGIVLSLLLRSLESFKADLPSCVSQQLRNKTRVFEPKFLNFLASLSSRVFSNDLRYDTIACFNLAAKLAPPNLTSFGAYSREYLDASYIKYLSESECAPKLRSLTFGCGEMTNDVVQSFAKFSSLTYA